MDEGLKKHKMKTFISDYNEGNYIWWIVRSYNHTKNTLCSTDGVKHFHWGIKNYVDI